MANSTEFANLLAFLGRVPAVQQRIGCGRFDNGNWWVKFGLDIEDPLAWHTVQELGCVLNYLSIDERLPTAFFPVSPAPYLNGGPRDFLSWVVESTDPEFSPDNAAQWLESRLPNPVDDLSQWQEQSTDNAASQYIQVGVSSRHGLFQALDFLQHVTATQIRGHE